RSFAPREMEGGWRARLRLARTRSFVASRVLDVARASLVAPSWHDLPRVAHLAPPRSARKLAARARIRSRRPACTPNLVGRHRGPARPGLFGRGRAHARGHPRGHRRSGGRHSVGDELVAGPRFGALGTAPARFGTRPGADRDPLRHPFGQTPFGVMVVGARPPRTRTARAPPQARSPQAPLIGAEKPQRTSRGSPLRIPRSPRPPLR